MFNLEDNELLSSMKKKMDREQKEADKRKPKKKIIPKESYLKKDDFDDLKQHFLNSNEEEVYDEEFERFKGQNERELRDKKVNKESEEVTKLLNEIN